MKSSAWIAAGVVALLVLGHGIADVSAAKRPQKTMSRAQIGEGFAVGSGAPVLGLKVEIANGQVTSVSSVEAAAANVFAERSNSEKQTMLNLRTDLDVTLKFDLYISRDGQTFEYTSTCAVTPGISGFEMWPYPVREFALGNPRVVPEGKMACE